MYTGFDLIRKNIAETINQEISSVGILYRLFSRVKENNSILEKIERKREEGTLYEPNGKLMQDIIGIRVVTYFQDDITIVRKIVERKFKEVGTQIDHPDIEVFKPKRTNIIYSINDLDRNTFDEVVKTASNDNLLVLDKTFELQLRTILSEGWHEIDHNLRYKCKKDWNAFKENERMLNGIYASLETNDIALKNLFNELAYKHFKAGNWEAMIRTKLRLNFGNSKLSHKILNIISSTPNIGKMVLKQDRETIIFDLLSTNMPMPITLDNLVYFINNIYIKNKKIEDITPDAFNIFR